MKVLYISYISTGSGWSKAAANNIRALQSVGIDVVYRDIRYSHKGLVDLDEDIIECEKKDLNNIDVCIQHVIPIHLVKTDKYKNISYLEYETKNLLNTSWRDYLEMMDEVWVPNKPLVKLVENDCKIKAVYIPHTHNISTYYESYENVVIPHLGHTYKFYSISDLNDRKNIESTIKAFHAAFDKDEPVSLILKVKDIRLPEQALGKNIQNLCTKIKKESRLYKYVSSYKSEFIISENITDNEVMALHNYADCFINTSHGEDWSIPTFDAMGMGKQIISSPTGASQYLKSYAGAYLLKGIDTLCRSSDSHFPDIYTGRDYWDNIDERELVEIMRKNYLNPQSYKSNGLKIAKNFSLENVGKMMKKALSQESKV